MFETLKQINQKPEAFAVYTAPRLWDDEHTSQQMLHFHLDDSVDISSRNSAFIDASVEWMTGHFDIRSGTRICDFGCGPGLYTTLFAERSQSVTGIDFSRRSIQYAKETAARKKLDVDYQQQNYLDYRSDRKFDLITMIMCDFCALSPLQRQTLLNVFHRHLDAGGSLLLDLFSEAAFNDREEGAAYEHRLLSGFWSAADYYGFVNTFKYDREKVVLDKYTIVDAAGTFEVYNWLQYFSFGVLKSEFEKAGFIITERYADIAGKPYDPESQEFAVVARKAGEGEPVHG
ncbi:MAG: class I SAM-dependent methyltransferase [bacterium]